MMKIQFIIKQLCTLATIGQAIRGGSLKYSVLIVSFLDILAGSYIFLVFLEKFILTGLIT